MNNKLYKYTTLLWNKQRRLLCYRRVFTAEKKLVTVLYLIVDTSSAPASVPQRTLAFLQFLIKECVIIVKVKTFVLPKTIERAYSKPILFYLLSFTWGIGISALGILVKLFLLLINIFRKEKMSRMKYGKCDIFFVGKGWGGLNLGTVCVVSNSSSDKTILHECGHSIQNAVYGPLMIILSISSVIRYWYREIRKSLNSPCKSAYDDYWFEGQATSWGNQYFNWFLPNWKRGSQSLNNRSKNEIAFCEKCEEYFCKENVLHNEPIFNGWDADVILPQYKLAILWNGPWHYRKITLKHSVKQYQTRDRIKIHEIQNCGYIPYVIKDSGGYNMKKVNEEFTNLLKYLKLKT